ncbi:MAG: acyltransferase [Solirubrobacterales bacterium]|nr:acyltransferase [Solirubrobacterales bacterium]
MIDQRGWRNWWRKRRWYERNRGWGARRSIDREMARRGAYVRHPIEGEVLEALRDGRLEVGQGTLFEPGCWLTIAPEGRIRIGEGCFLNRETMIAAQEEVTIGDHVMLANGCFVGDASHRYDDPELPVTWQGFVPEGPVTIGSNCWIGVHAVVTGGVTIGERCVVGANSVVTHDLPSGVVAAGVPARVIREIEFRPGSAQPSGSQSQE